MFDRKSFTWGKKRIMKVFISWSGKTSFEVAKVLKEWIPCVIQGIEPYFSSDDIDKGARWGTDIAKELEEAEFGILCVTKDNLKSQWLNFEAGALSKAIDKSKVCPFLFDLQPSNISNSPILQFQMTSVDRDDMYKLFQSMNKALGEGILEEQRLKKMFELSWSKIDEALKSVENKIEKGKSNKTEKEELSQQHIFEEMLDLLRSQQVMLMNPQRLFPADYFKRILSDTNSYNLKTEVANRIPIALIEEYRMVKRRLGGIKDILENISEEGENSMSAIVRDYVNTTEELLMIEGELFDRLGLGRAINIKKR